MTNETSNETKEENVNEKTEEKKVENETKVEDYTEIIYNEFLKNMGKPLLVLIWEN